MDKLNRNVTDFSFTEKLNEYARNAEWRAGYDQVRDGRLIKRADGTVDFKNNENFSTLWYTLSSAFEYHGNDIYTHISHLQESVRDIDTCSVHTLSSIAAELDADAVQIFDINYPLEIRRIVDTLSISKNRLLNLDILNADSVDSIITDSSEVISGAMDGYDNALSAGWSQDQLDSINTLMSGYDHISLTGWNDFIDSEISATLLTNLSLDGLLDELKALYDSDPTTNPTITTEDSTTIEDLKLTYQVKKSFHAKVEADKVIAGIKFINEYKSNEQIIIEAEIKAREDQQKFGDYLEVFRRYKYERLKKVREYVGFIENINVYNSQYTTVDDTFYSSGVPVSFFAEVDSVPVSGDLIQNATYTIRNIILKTSYQRENLKNIARKHAIIGTSRIVQTIISEYIARHFSSTNYWGYHSFPEISGPTTDISNLEVIDEELSSNILGDIKIIEYYDTTEYMNISGSTDSDTVSGLVNARFWEGDDAATSILLSEHTSAEISAFYHNLGLDLTASELDLFLSHIYDTAALTATMYPEFGYSPYTLTSAGTFGDYGQYTYTYSFPYYVLSLSADALAEYEYQVTPEYNTWVSSPLISATYPSPSATTSATFLTDWLDTPEASTWIYGMQIETVEGTTDLIIDNSLFNFDGESDVSAWVVDTYKITGWVENEVTNIWQDSLLISRLSIDEFKAAWAESPIVSTWTNFANISAPSAPFDRLDWASVPEYLDYLNDDLSGVTPTTSQWLSSDFIRSWNTAPFEIGNIGVDFDQDTDWELSSNPYISGWINGDPFDYSLINSGDILSSINFNTEVEIAEYLYALDAIDAPSGGYQSALSAMYRKYSGDPSGTFAPANHKNTVHPTVAMQPYLWNLYGAIDENYFFEDIYAPIITSFEDLSGRIDELGAPINMWKKKSLDFTGYRTFYEDSRNLDINLIEDERIDTDGPWYATALKAFLDPVSGVTSAMLANFYTSIGLDVDETAVISAQIDNYRSNIESLSAKIIYNYAVDGFGNHYTLFKDEDEFDLPGELWIRYRNHPLSFPLVDLSSTLTQVDMSNLNTPNYLLVTAATSKCLDFGVEFIGTENILWFYGSTDSATSDTNYLQWAAPSFVVFAPIIDTVGGDSHLIEFNNWNNGFEKKQVDRDNYRYIGTYANQNDLVIAKALKAGYPEPGSIASLNLISGGSYDTYKLVLEWDTQNIYTGNNITKTTVNNLKYAEYFPSPSGNETHNPWKLAKGDDNITMAFECAAPSASNEYLFYGSGNDENAPYDPATNDECKFYDNGITVLNFDISENTSIGNKSRDPVIGYYFGYTDLTYLGINANNGITTSMRNYDIDYDECVKFQYFGNTETSAVFVLNNDTIVTCFNTSGDQFGIQMGFGSPTWDSTFCATSAWEDLSAFAWEDVIDLSSKIFTYEGERFPALTATPSTLSGYSVTYNGSGCHLFEICYTSG